MAIPNAVEGRFEGMESSKAEACEGVFERRKHLAGVSKLRNRWQARVRHPVLKYDIYLGSSYHSPEEAALAVKEKKAEFVEMLKGENDASLETIGDEFVGKKLPCGVSRRGYSTWGARIWHPELRYNVSLGTYSSPEDAELVVNKTKELYRKMYGGAKRTGLSCDCESLGDDFSQDHECGEASASECLDENNNGDVKVPNGVRMCESGKWVAGIIVSGSKSRIWLGTYTTVEEAVKAYNRKQVALAVKRRRAEFEMSECRNKFTLDNKAVGAVGDSECEFRNGCVKSVLTTENLSSRAVNDESNNGVVVDAPDEQHSGFVHGSPTSAFNLVNSNSAYANNQQGTNSASNFDEAMSLGFINEYGQLQGEYSVLDEQMGLSLPDECVAATKVQLEMDLCNYEDLCNY